MSMQISVRQQTIQLYYTVIQNQSSFKTTLLNNLTGVTPAHSCNYQLMCHIKIRLNVSI